MCGVFGVQNHRKSAELTYFGLYALQHRGEECAGIVTFDGSKSFVHNGLGLVEEVFSQNSLKELKGNLAIGHNRYSTTGSSYFKNVQPFLVRHRKNPIAVSHNGNLVNTLSLHQELEETGAIFQSTMDSEIIVHLIARSRKKKVEDKVVEGLSALEGAYSVAVLMGDLLVGARDPYGIRPLCLGKLRGSYCLASETCALDIVKAKYVREIEPGEVVFIYNDNMMHSIKPFKKEQPARCIFEYIYFSRPDSNIFGENVYLARKRLGEQLYGEEDVPADLVISIPDSGSYAAIGYAQKSGLPFDFGVIRNHYVGRTFIQPSQLMRDFKVKIKLNPIKNVVKNKRLIVVEDSIVRGTTTKNRIRMLREAGAKEIHLCISCPPIKYPCYYGIDFPTREELVASKLSVKEIGAFIGVDSLRFLSFQGMLDAMPFPGEEFCTACFNGNYPITPCLKASKRMLEK